MQEQEDQMQADVRQHEHILQEAMTQAMEEDEEAKRDKLAKRKWNCTDSGGVCFMGCCWLTGVFTGTLTACFTSIYILKKRAEGRGLQQDVSFADERHQSQRGVSIAEYADEQPLMQSRPQPDTRTADRRPPECTFHLQRDEQPQRNLEFHLQRDAQPRRTLEQSQSDEQPWTLFHSLQSNMVEGPQRSRISVWAIIPETYFKLIAALHVSSCILGGTLGGVRERCVDDGWLAALEGSFTVIGLLTVGIAF